MFGPDASRCPIAEKGKRHVGERGASALIKSSKGWGEPHSAGAEAALLPLRPPALPDEFRGDVLLPVSTKAALYSTPARPRLAGSRARSGLPSHGGRRRRPPPLPGSPSQATAGRRGALERPQCRQDRPLPKTKRPQSGALCAVLGCRSGGLLLRYLQLPRLNARADLDRAR